MLFEPPQAHFFRFCQDYDLPQLRTAFSPQDIEVVENTEGHALTDIVTATDNAVVADAIMQRVRALAADENSAIHASVAGGRKTMGVALALAMSLFGRVQDALSHVLVSPPFESHPEFFYPPRTPRVLITGAPPQQKPVSTADAEVSLAEIPFLRLRQMLPQELLAGANSWQELIRRAQASISTPTLVIDLQTKSFRAGEKPLDMSPANAAFLLMLAQRRKEGRPTYCPQEGAPEKELARDYLVAMDKLGFSGERHARTRSALRHGMEKDFFERRKSAVNRAFREALGPGPAGAFIIGRHRDANGRHRHDLPLQPEQIIIREE